jgi:hypothetical protein
LVKSSYEEPAASYEPAERSFKHKMSALAYRAGLWPEKRILDSVPVGTAHSYQSKSRRPTTSNSSVPLFSPKTRSS